MSATLHNLVDFGRRRNLTAVMFHQSGSQISTCSNEKRKAKASSGQLCTSLISGHWAKFHSDHLGYFQQLYEEELGKVAFTNWEAVDEDTGRQREKELKGIHLKYALERGASIQRFTNDYRSAIKIISLGMGEDQSKSVVGEPQHNR